MARRPKYAAYGRRGGLAKNRALSAEERAQVARHAVAGRWKRSTKQERQSAARKAARARWAAWRAAGKPPIRRRKKKDGSAPKRDVEK